MKTNKKILFFIKFALLIDCYSIAQDQPAVLSNNQVTSAKNSASVTPVQLDNSSAESLKTQALNLNQVAVPQVQAQDTVQAAQVQAPVVVATTQVPVNTQVVTQVPVVTTDQVLAQVADPAIKVETQAQQQQIIPALSAVPEQVAPADTQVVAQVPAIATDQVLAQVTEPVIKVETQAQQQQVLPVPEQIMPIAPIEQKSDLESLENLPEIELIDDDQEEEVIMTEQDIKDLARQKKIQTLRNKKPLETQMREFLHPWDPETENDLIKVNFNNASLLELLSFMQNNYKVTFLTDEVISPASASAAKLSAGTITFKSYSALNRKELWNLFSTFLDMAGFALVPGNNPRIFKVVSAENNIANKMPLPSYIGVDYNNLPDSDIRIRYVYFVHNAEINNLLPIIDNIRSPGSSQVIQLPEMRAIIMTDKSANIRAILKIIQELDTVALPEVMSIIRLSKATASDVQNFYDSITKDDTISPFGRMGTMGGAKKDNINPFLGARIVAEPRTNTLFVFGTQKSVPLVEDFIRNHIDRDIPAAYGGIQIYRAKFIDAESIVSILSKVTKFDPNSPASIYGGIRDGEKFFKSNLEFVAEPKTNSIIIKGDYEDYLKILEILKRIDVEQPQVAIRAVVVQIDLDKARMLGTQLRNTNYGLNPDSSSNLAPVLGPTGLLGIAGKNLTFQTSGSGPGVNTPIIQNSNPAAFGSAKLLGDLVGLATSGTAGSSLVALGNDAFGTWGMFQVLQRFIGATVIANPFLITTHNYPALFSFGEERRVASGTISGGGNNQTSLTSLAANLSVSITPIISTDGLINLDVDITNNNFTVPFSESNPNSPVNGDRTERRVVTKATVADKEVLALGGFIKTTVTERVAKVPVLGDIPILGWFFKNKNKEEIKSSLLILISAEIVDSSTDKAVDAFTQDKIDEVNIELSYSSRKCRRDPVYKWFFGDDNNEEYKEFKDFLKIKDAYLSDAEKLRRKQRLTPDIVVAQDKNKNNKNKLASSSKNNKKLLDLVDLESGIQA